MPCLQNKKESTEMIETNLIGQIVYLNPKHYTCENAKGTIRMMRDVPGEKTTVLVELRDSGEFIATDFGRISTKKYHQCAK